MHSPSTDGSNEMAKLVVFGDLAASFEEDLRNLLYQRDDEALQSFLARVAFSLRQELSLQPIAVQDLFPHFTTIIDVVSKLGETDGTPVLRFFLLTVCQISQFIHYFRSRSFPPANSTYALGICTGSFAAAAVSVSHSLSDVITAGVEASRAAFRTALCSFLRKHDMARALNMPWSAIVARKLPLENMLKGFHKEKSASKASEIYISATTPSSITLSGNPGMLSEFIASNKIDCHWLSVESPFHAPHLFTDREVEELSAGVGIEIPIKSNHIKMLSGSNGAEIKAESFNSLIKQVSRDVLMMEVNWQQILESTSSAIKKFGHGRCEIYPFHCNALSMLSSFLIRQANIEPAVYSTKAIQGNAHTHNTGRFDHSKIAIIGYSGRFPESDSPEEFWDLLREGRDVHRTIPEDRFDWEAHYDPSGKKKNTSKVKYGCFIKNPGLFDARFFNMSPREADNTDPAQRLAITSTYEAMEMAGLVLNRTPSTQQDRIGVFFGVTSDDWREVNSGQNVDTYFIPGGNRAFVPGRISYFFRFSGPSLSIDTACSSSFAAIQTACGYLWRGECDTAVAGGTNVLTNPDNFAGLDRGHFLSTTGNCNAFDDEASGYCRADAVGSVILKRLDDAIADNDPIFGVITGTNTNHCGQTDSITRPHEGDQASVFKRVMRYHNVDCRDVSYIEMHGTGTQAGDATEMRSVLSVFLPEDCRAADKPLYLGSAKANIGHSESASGVTSLIKVLMMMKNSEIPPHCGIKNRINRNYPKDLAERNVHIAKQTTPWLREDSANQTRRVFLNNFSAAGGNTAILLEDAPVHGHALETAPAENNRGTFTVTVTAKSAAALAANIHSLASFLSNNNTVNLQALSYTTTARRMHHSYRVACSGESISAILANLKRQAVATSDIKPVPVIAKLPKIAFMFTGQGAVYLGMGKRLFAESAEFKRSITRLDRIARQEGFPTFLPLIDGSAETLDGHNVCAIHLALVCLQIALVELWASWGVTPAVVVGHSLGEYAALFAAKVITATDAVFLVGTRATILQEKCTPGTHAMVAVKASVDVVQKIISHSDCEVACRNQPTGCVISGRKVDIDALTVELKEKGYECVPLDIPFAFHSAQVDPILSDFEVATRSIEYQTPSVDVLSPFFGTVLRGEGSFDSNYFVQACRAPVNFQGALESAETTGIVDKSTIWLEIGPHPTCSGMVKGTFGSDFKTLTSLRRSTDDWKTLAASLESIYLAGFPVDWNSYHCDIKGAVPVIPLPRYSWDVKNHWIMYKNNFCLTKGDTDSSPPKAILPSKHERPTPTYRYISPSIQRVLEEEYGCKSSSILVESDAFHAQLFGVFSGHVVNGARLCPSSLYGDIALTLAKELVDKTDSTKNYGFDVCNVKVTQPLIALPSETTHLFRVSAKANWSESSISYSIYTVNEQGKTTANHASLNVKLFADISAQWVADWNSKAYLINGRIKTLEHDVLSGSTHRLKQRMVYKLFKSIVSYSPDYQGIQDVMLDTTGLEATAKVKFQVGSNGFTMNPHWIDSLGQIAGFIMNGNENLQSDQVFINHGWGRMRFSAPLSGDKIYTTYNKMQLMEGTSYSGDTYILDGDQIVAVYEGVVFQGVPRRLLDGLLPSTKGKAASDNEIKPSVKSTPPPYKPAPTQPAVSTPTTAVKSSQFDQVLLIISDEAGVPLKELQADSEFASFGIDSLLSLTVTSRISEEIGIELPSSLFAEYPTVKELENVINLNKSSVSTTPSLTPQVTSDSEVDTSYELVDMDEVSGVNIGDIMNQVITEETGVPADSLLPSTSLTDLGVDSLLSLTIADALSDALGTEISNTLLQENETLMDIEKVLRESLGLGEKPPIRGPSKAALVSATTKPALDKVVQNAPHATSVLLQAAKVKPNRGCLFLFPDGSGSASSYASIDKLDPSFAVYGLNCPWRTTPEDMAQAKVQMAQLVAKYIIELRNRQPTGPYHLGGWSAGGICAFEATRQLQEVGEVVESLILIDSPNPIGLQNPPARMYDFFQELGIFGGPGPGSKNVPTWLRKHFDAFISLLDAYKPVPLKYSPATLLIYARDGICKDDSTPRPEMKPDDPREMIWLINNRTDFSADGWASLIGRGRLTVEVLDNVNHFTMMDRGPGMYAMSGYMRRFIST